METNDHQSAGYQWSLEIDRDTETAGGGRDILMTVGIVLTDSFTALHWEGDIFHCTILLAHCTHCVCLL